MLPWLWWNGGILEVAIPASSIRHQGGFAYSVQILPLVKHSFRHWNPVPGQDPVSFFFRVIPDVTDRSGSPVEPRSTLELYEDGKLLGPAHSNRREIHREGLGRYAHLHRTLLLSTSDNSNPRRNGRRYSLRRICQPRLAPLPIAVVAITWSVGVALLLTAAFRWRHIIRLIELNGADSRRALFASFQIAVFTFYAFSFSILKRDLALKYLFFLALSSALFLFVFRQRLIFRKWMIWPTFFLFYSMASFALPHTTFASWTTGMDLLLGSALGVVIFSAMYHGLEERTGFAALFVLAICLLLSLAMLLQNCGFDLKSAAASIEGFHLPWRSHVWTNKYQETWLLILTWSVVSATATLHHRRRMVSSLVLTLSGLATLSGYSYTAKATYLSGVAVFLCSFWAPKAVRTSAAVISAGLLLSMPVLAGQVWHAYMANPSLIDEERGAGVHLAKRLVIWEYSRELIAERPWLGWGLGASKRLPGTKFSEPAEALMTDGSLLPHTLKKTRPLAGGHPHSLPLLIWLDTGAIGTLLVCGFLLTLFRKLGRIQSRYQHSALLALAVSLLLVFALNYPAWDVAVLMLVIMTGALVASIHSSDGIDGAVRVAGGEPRPPGEGDRTDRPFHGRRDRHRRDY